MQTYQVVYLPRTTFHTGRNISVSTCNRTNETTEILTFILFAIIVHCKDSHDDYYFLSKLFWPRFFVFSLKLLTNITNCVTCYIVLKWKAVCCHQFCELTVREEFSLTMHSVRGNVCKFPFLIKLAILILYYIDLRWKVWCHNLEGRASVLEGFCSETFAWDSFQGLWMRISIRTKDSNMIYYIILYYDLKWR